MMLMIFVPKPTHANAAAPPSIVIIVNNPPEDLSIELLSDGEDSDVTFVRSGWEGYYAVYFLNLRAEKNLTFQISTDSESYQVATTNYPKEYNNVYTLNLSTRELTPGTYPFRSVILVSIRLLATLLLEGLVFWIFQYRQKRSWLVFLTINLVTQIALNIWLDHGSSPLTYTASYALIFGEFFVFLIEMITLPIFIKEHKWFRATVYAFIANLVSFGGGLVLLSYLPV